jgi:hypothetical protein
MLSPVLYFYEIFMGRWGSLTVFLPSLPYTLIKQHNQLKEFRMAEAPTIKAKGPLVCVGPAHFPLKLVKAAQEIGAAVS